MTHIQNLIETNSDLHEAVLNLISLYGTTDAAQNASFALKLSRFAQDKRKEVEAKSEAIKAYLNNGMTSEIAATFGFEFAA